MNCKPGDLAIVTGGGVPQNIGKIVEVKHLDFPGAIRCGIALGGNEPAWYVIGNLWTCNGRGLDVRQVSDLHYADRYLRPISGVPVGEDVRDEVTA